MKKLFITTLLFLSLASNMAAKGFYFNAAVGTTLSIGTPPLALSSNFGYTFGRSTISVYNQASNGYIKGLALEYNFQAPVTEKVAFYSITGVSPFNVLSRADGIKKIIQSTKKYSFEIGGGAKVYVSEKIALTLALRASLFPAMNYETGKNRYISPLTFTFGLGK